MQTVLSKRYTNTYMFRLQEQNCYTLGVYIYIYNLVLKLHEEKTPTIRTKQMRTPNRDLVVPQISLQIGNFVFDFRAIINNGKRHQFTARVFHSQYVLWERDVFLTVDKLMSIIPRLNTMFGQPFCLNHDDSVLITPPRKDADY